MDISTMFRCVLSPSRRRLLRTAQKGRHRAVSLWRLFTTTKDCGQCVLDCWLLTVQPPSVMVYCMTLVGREGIHQESNRMKHVWWANGVLKVRELVFCTNIWHKKIHTFRHVVFTVFRCSWLMILIKNKFWELIWYDKAGWYRILRLI